MINISNFMTKIYHLKLYISLQTHAGDFFRVFLHFWIVKVIISKRSYQVEGLKFC